MHSDFPQLSVIHDLNFLHHPEWLPDPWARYYAKWFPRFARRANVLATVSDFSRMDLAESMGLVAEDIRVIPNAPDGVFHPLDQVEVAKAQQEFAGGRRYFVFVGSLHPRKNIHGLLNAFVAYREAGGQSDLVVVGEAMWNQVQSTMPAEHRQGVHWVGRLEDEALNLAIGGAQAMMFIPWFEGFGIPIVEAMACGTPVIASNTSSIPEVCGDAAFALKAPDDAEGLAQAMRALEADEDGRMQAIHRGKLRAGQFDWSRSGALLDRAVESLLASNP
jgi:glycosyltransferase involved in cell wall biosynthesis